MHDKYANWIRRNVPPVCDGLCGSTTLEMAEAFPELQRMAGHYICPLAGTQPHWWLLTPDGEIIDPTARQFPSQGQGEYQPWPAEQPLPTGVCANCGEYAYDHQTCCSDECSRAYVLYLEHEARKFNSRF